MRSTWIGFELSILGKELTLAGIQEEPVSVFVRTLPLRYYTILLVIFCTANAVMLRDFGPMLLAEQRARRTDNTSPTAQSAQESIPAAAAPVDIETHSSPDAAASLQHAINSANVDPSAASAAARAPPPNPAVWYLAAIPIAVMSVTMGCGIVVDGRSKILEQDPDRSTSALVQAASVHRALCGSRMLAGMMDILSATDTSKALRLPLHTFVHALPQSHSPLSSVPGSHLVDFIGLRCRHHIVCSQQPTRMHTMYHSHNMLAMNVMCARSSYSPSHDNMCVALKRLCLEAAVEAWVEGIRVVVPGTIHSLHSHALILLASFAAASKRRPQVYSY